MKRVAVLANNLSQASFRVRIAALAPFLAERGFELDILLRPRGFFAAPRLFSMLRDAGRAHATVVQRKMLSPWEARVLRASARQIIYDIDDALMHHNRPVSAISRWRTNRRLNATIAALDHVAAGNEHLANFFRERGVGATVIPTMVDCARYTPKTHAATATPRLVWIGSNSTLIYLKEYLPALEQAARLVPGLRLVTIGDQTVSSNIITIEHRAWTESTECADLCRGDIGIAPTPADEWTQGKCGFKILQYMAAGLPVIASPVGANEQIVVKDKTGLLPATPADWPDAIAHLAADVSLRADLGRLGRERAQSDYSLARAADLWAGILDSTTSK